ncbi:EscU/YscU/HrcU family type III secretion system export apparatus switch protein [Pseudoduganella albidiflava]|uniref:Flagellar biosynthesis protein FlhB n=1 Tax=Pseudoduganella albidiflava TaxID=321983 RepID=A0A411WWF7_9BURK|nr:flagellar type III secretion system protein FlhB [Pseudoduganella albidiflava]QBI01086.1 flagellar type III secretion system protein FlhB [Pseudoduganella albidiflava]GGY48013.1 flagellar biosynthesis protein FlhB [Pseudoduganella albidiflava]
MADSGDKTEKASQQKLKKAREEGQVTRSKDLATAIGILVSLRLFVYLLPDYLDHFRTIFAASFIRMDDGGDVLMNAMSDVFYESSILLVKMVAPLFVVPLFIVLSSMLPGGWMFSTKNLMPKFSKMNPVSNLGRLFGGKAMFELGVSIVKVGILIAVLVHMARSTLNQYTQLQALPMQRAMTEGAALMLDGVMSMVVIFILFAVIDVPAQAFFFAKNQRMSKQDLKEEHKSSEGRPEVKGRIRQLQRAMSQRAARKTVPTADVVIVNPEHYAVALKYDDKRAEAPFVVAKGVDELAQYIRLIAEEHDIEVLRLAPLARAIYNTAQVNQQIPVPLYQAVSQVLHYVFQMKAFRTGGRQARPDFPDQIVVPTSMSEASQT